MSKAVADGCLREVVAVVVGCALAAVIAGVLIVTGVL